MRVFTFPLSEVDVLIIGHFGNCEQPQVDAILLFPRYMFETNLRFLVDTGSDITLIHPADLQRAGIPISQLTAGSGTGGVGGQTATWVEPAIIRFFDHDGFGRYDYRLDVEIAQPTEHNRNFPSLLGMDVLSCWYTECDPINDLLRFTVRRTL